MKLKIGQALYEELIWSYEVLNEDSSNWEPEEQNELVNPIYKKLQKNEYEFTVDEVIDIYAEIINSEDKDCWQEPKIKKDIKNFYIDNNFCEVLTKKELDLVTVWSSRGGKCKKYEYKKGDKYYNPYSVHELVNKLK